MTQSSSLPSCYLPLFIPVLRTATFSKDTASCHADVVGVLQAFATRDDALKEATLLCCRCEVCEILLELLRIAPRLDPSPESVLMSYCDSAPSLQPREVLLLIGDRGMLSSSEDVRLNSLLNLASLDSSRVNPLYVVGVIDLVFI